MSTSSDNAEYAGEFVDWGCKIISGDIANTWRTMTANEWGYLLEKRTNANQLYGVAMVSGVNGLIVLPDNWVCPEGISFQCGLYSEKVDNYALHQSFHIDEWKRMENAGAVFLPASGFRDGIMVDKQNLSGYYWSSTSADSNNAYRMYFYSYF